jgi:hypothetical protein
LQFHCDARVEISVCIVEPLPYIFDLMSEVLVDFVAELPWELEEVAWRRHGVGIVVLESTWDTGSRTSCLFEILRGFRELGRYGPLQGKVT